MILKAHARFGLLLLLLGGCTHEQLAPKSSVDSSDSAARPRTLDLREPMALAANAIPLRLDPALDYRPWFLLRGSNGVPTTPEHASWDLGDMTGRYLESLILTRRMGVSTPELSQAEARLGRFLFRLLGADGLVHDPNSGAIDHSFSQGSTLYGLLAWFEDTHDPRVRTAIERLITGQLKRAERRGDQLVDPSVKLDAGAGSLLAGYQIYPCTRFYELTGYPDALELSEGLTRWCLADPVLADTGEIKSTDSWQGHHHSWLDTLAGCVRTARISRSLDRDRVIAKAKAVYDWVRRSNMTDFGWIATFPTHLSSETCAMSSVIRLALELAACGHTQYLGDVERFARNQVVGAQFRDLKAYEGGGHRPTPLMLGCFDSQSMPNGHSGPRGTEDVGTVEGCCLNGGMRALALAWEAIQTVDETGMTVNFALSRNGPGGEVIGYQPFEGRIDVIPRAPGGLRVRVPDWASPDRISVDLAGRPAQWKLENGFVVLDLVPGGATVSVRYPLREFEEDVIAGGKKYHVRWKGDVVVGIDPPGKRAPIYQSRTGFASLENLPATSVASPDTYELQDAARLAASSMLARMDLQRDGQPFFRIYPFKTPPRAEHEKWDDGDMTGRYVEALILSRRLTGLPIDAREPLLRHYLAGLFDPNDGLCYSRAAEWAQHRACLFSQSSAMLGLLAWHRETGSPEARRLLDRQAEGLRSIAVDTGNAAYFPKYEFDGRQYVNEPPDKNAPLWYGGRCILPLVEYWQLSERDDIRVFLEKLVRYCTEVSQFIKPDGEVERGEAWWGHLHGTMDMTAGIAEFGRLTRRPELIQWAKRVYDWAGRTQATRYGWVPDVSGGHICESCGIASRFRLGLALYRAGVADPFSEIDRHLRNQLLENQFVDLSFLPPLQPATPRTDKACYAGVDRMIRGTFQCWGTANDLLGHDDIEGCGAGGGTQGLALAWDAQSEWRKLGPGRELRVHLLFNRRLRGPIEPPFTSAAPVAAELWSFLPFEGRVVVLAHQPIDRLALRLPDGADASGARVRRSPRDFASASAGQTITPEFEGPYALVPNLALGEKIELLFPLKQYETVEHAAGKEYQVRWKGSSVVGLEPAGQRVPLYTNRARLLQPSAPRGAPRYP